MPVQTKCLNPVSLELGRNACLQSQSQQVDWLAKLRVFSQYCENFHDFMFTALFSIEDFMLFRAAGCVKVGPPTSPMTSATTRVTSARRWPKNTAGNHRFLITAAKAVVWVMG